MRSRAATILYQKLLRLYPEGFRAEFGAEMLETFEDSARECRAEGVLALTRFYLREARGLIHGAVTRDSVRQLLVRVFRRWSTPLLAGILAGGVFLLGALFAGGPFIFSPLLNIFALLVLAAASIWAGRIRSCLRSRSRLRTSIQSALALFLLLGAVPAARLMDAAYLDAMAERGGKVAYAIPGIRITAEASTSGSVDVRGRSGQVYSKSNPGPTHDLVAIWQRFPSSPPYEWIIVLLSIVLALISYEIGGARSDRTIPTVAIGSR